MSYVHATKRWLFHIIGLNVHARTEDTFGDVKGSFSEELERLLDTFPIYDVKMLLGNFSAKIGSEDLLNKQLGPQVYTKLVLMILLE
jgi:hypothetical protein